MYLQKILNKKYNLLIIILIIVLLLVLFLFINHNLRTKNREKFSVNLKHVGNIIFNGSPDQDGLIKLPGIFKITGYKITVNNIPNLFKYKLLIAESENNLKLNNVVQIKNEKLNPILNTDGKYLNNKLMFENNNQAKYIGSIIKILTQNNKVIPINTNADDTLLRIKILGLNPSAESIDFFQNSTFESFSGGNQTDEPEQDNLKIYKIKIFNDSIDNTFGNKFLLSNLLNNTLINKITSTINKLLYNLEIFSVDDINNVNLDFTSILTSTSNIESYNVSVKYSNKLSSNNEYSIEGPNSLDFTLDNDQDEIFLSNYVIANKFVITKKQIQSSIVNNTNNLFVNSIYIQFINKITKLMETNFFYNKEESNSIKITKEIFKSIYNDEIENLILESSGSMTQQTIDKDELIDLFFIAMKDKNNNIPCLDQIETFYNDDSTIEIKAGDTNTNNTNPNNTINTTTTTPTLTTTTTTPTLTTTTTTAITQPIPIVCNDENKAKASNIKQMLNLFSLDEDDTSTSTTIASGIPESSNFNFLNKNESILTNEENNINQAQVNLNNISINVDNIMLGKIVNKIYLNFIEKFTKNFKNEFKNNVSTEDYSKNPDNIENILGISTLSYIAYGLKPTKFEEDKFKISSIQNLKDKQMIIGKDKCPSMSTMINNQVQIQQICESLEYRDKIKNNKILYERDKEYLKKLEKQDKSIKELEIIINNLVKKKQERLKNSDKTNMHELEEEFNKAEKLRQDAKNFIDSKKSSFNKIDFNVNLNPNIQEIINA